MRIVYMGTPGFAVPPLEYLISNRYTVVSVFTRPDRPAGRGRLLVPPPVKGVAQGWGLPLEQPASLRKAEVVAQLEALAPDVIVVAAFGQLLPQSVLEIPRYGCLNLHPSLLPKYRGASPVAAAILAGDEFSGVTIMLMDKGLDSGPVLARAQIPVAAADTAGSLADKLSRVAARLLGEVLVRWLRGEITPRPQDEAEASYRGEITRQESEIDWHLPAVDIWRRVRAFQPWPGCYSRWQGKQLKIVEAVPFLGETGVEVGRVVLLPPPAGGGAATAFGVVSGVGVVGVCRVQLEGKRAMSAAEFLRGQPDLIGATLPHPAKYQAGET